MAGRKPSRGNLVRRDRNRIHLQRNSHCDRRRVSCLRAAEGHPKVGTLATTGLNRKCQQPRYPNGIDRFERISIEDPVLDRAQDPLRGVLSGNPPGQRGEIVRSKTEEAGDTSKGVGDQGRSGGLNHGSDPNPRSPRLIRSESRERFGQDCADLLQLCGGGNHRHTTAQVDVDARRHSLIDSTDNALTLSCQHLGSAEQKLRSSETLRSASGHMVGNSSSVHVEKSQGDGPPTQRNQHRRERFVLGSGQLKHCRNFALSNSAQQPKVGGSDLLLCSAQPNTTGAELKCQLHLLQRIRVGQDANTAFRHLVGPFQHRLNSSWEHVQRAPSATNFVPLGKTGCRREPRGKKI